MRLKNDRIYWLYFLFFIYPSRYFHWKQRCSQIEEVKGGQKSWLDLFVTFCWDTDFYIYQHLLAFSFSLDWELVCDLIPVLFLHSIAHFFRMSVWINGSCSQWNLFSHQFHALLIIWHGKNYVLYLVVLILQFQSLK